jgi:acyl carrier protein
MDSLMMLELRTTVEATLQIELPMMSLAQRHHARRCRAARHAARDWRDSA